MQPTTINFPRAGWLGAKIKAATVRKFIRKATKKIPSPKQMQALKDKFRK